MRYDFVTLARTRRWAWPKMRNPDLLSLSHYDAAAYVGINIPLYSIDIHAWSKPQSLFAIVKLTARALNFSSCFDSSHVCHYSQARIQIYAQVSDARLHSHLATLQL